MRVKKTSGTKVGNDILSYIKENKEGLTTQVRHGSVEVEVLNGILTGGHFKLRSAMKQAGLSMAEIDNALA